ncbi:SDR family oxidoreductase [Hyphomicrobiales bacterium]|jgi:NADP-dependent 3-hydroxy acid dehydrogenase YdfG|nr:SDR family oxidoreductase [Hyphomicrobiales bacterium]|tara:strand:+ start:352 stop:1092 length:741 start_codon:yes stop_codon:yes gene_type:complete
MSCIKGKVILITGASSGFGMVTAKKCVEHGAKVVLAARREDRLKDLCESLGSDNAIFMATDVTRKEDLNNIVKYGIDTFNQIDSLVNNAGIMPLSFIEQGRTDEWDQMIDVNIKGVLYAIDAVYSHMMERGSGQIINISSVAGKRLIPGSAVYSGTKFAVAAISEGLRIESEGKLQVTCIFPGAFETELGASIKDEKMLEYLTSEAKYANLAQPAEIVADAIIYSLEQKPGVAANEIVLRPTAQDF